MSDPKNDDLRKRRDAQFALLKSGEIIPCSPLARSIINSWENMTPEERAEREKLFDEIVEGCRPRGT